MKLSDHTLQLGAYLLIVVVGAFGFYQIDEQSDQRVKDRNEQQVALCEEAASSRDAIRDGIVSFNDFLASTVTPEKANDPATIQGLAKLEAYEKAQLKKYPALKCDSKGKATPTSDGR